MSNFWNREEDSVSEFELLEDSIQNSLEEIEETPIYEADDIDDGVLDEIVEDSAFDLDEDQAVTIFNARIRLEQANLYEMLINHNLFEGVDASQRAIDNVQNELKAFIVARLELLLGIKKPVRKETVIREYSDLNPMELDFLKALANKGTKGASSQYGENRTVEDRSVEVKPVKTVKKVNTIKPLAQKKAVVQRKTQPIREEIVEEPLPSKPKKTVKKKRKEKPSKTISKTSTKNMTVEEIAMKDLEETKNKKAFARMTAKEKAAEIVRVNNKYAKKPVPPTAAPMMSVEHQQMKYMTQQQKSSTQKGMGGFNNMIATAIAAQKQQGE